MTRDKQASFEQRMSMLAKMMAKENINVQFDGACTGARFNLKDRTLVFPLYKDLAESEGEMIVGHEIAHALETPEQAWINAIERGVAAKKSKQHKEFYQMILNVIEDARIERLTKVRYPGMKKVFYYGYERLFTRGIWGTPAQVEPELQDNDILYLPTKLNLEFKLPGKFKFSTDQKFDEYKSKIENCTTFDDVVAIADSMYKEIIDKVKNPPPLKQQQQPNGGSGDGEGEDSSEQNPSGDSQDSQGSGGSGKSKNGDEKKKKNQKGKSGGNQKQEEKKQQEEKQSSDQSQSESESDSPEDGDSSDGDSDQISDSQAKPETGKLNGSAGVKPKSLTEEQLEKKIQEAMTKNMDQQLKDFLQNKRDKTTVVNYVLPEADLSHIIVPYTEVLRSVNAMSGTLGHGKDNLDENGNVIITVAPPKYKSFTRERKSSIESLSRMFQMKKSAQESVRRMTFKTGRLDTNRLSQYKTSDSIFKTATYVQSGKNHGYVLVVDFSGSMRGTMFNTIKQLLEIVSFCRMNSIPIEVYAFSDTYTVTDYLYVKNGLRRNGYNSGTLKQFSNGVNLPESFNFGLVELFSWKMKQNDFIQMADALLTTFASTSYACMSEYFMFGGTPLGPAILTVPSLVQKMRKETKAEIMHVIFLTDGDDTTFSYYGGSAVNVRDSRTKISLPVHKTGYGRSLTESFTKLISIALDDVQLINFYITTSKLPGDATYYSEQKDERGKRGFDKLFYVSPKAFSKQQDQRGELIKEQRTIFQSFMDAVA